MRAVCSSKIELNDNRFLVRFAFSAVNARIIFGMMIVKDRCVCIYVYFSLFSNLYINYISLESLRIEEVGEKSD